MCAPVSKKHVPLIRRDGSRRSVAQTHLLAGLQQGALSYSVLPKGLWQMEYACRLHRGGHQGWVDAADRPHLCAKGPLNYYSIHIMALHDLSGDIKGPGDERAASPLPSAFSYCTGSSGTGVVTLLLLLAGPACILRQQEPIYRSIQH